MSQSHTSPLHQEISLSTSRRENTPPLPLPRQGWLLYDDSCGFCRSWVPAFESLFRHYGYEIAPLQSKWIQESLNIHTDDLLQDFRLLLANGSQLFGANAYRHIFRHIWWLYPFFLLASAPGLRLVFDWSYRTFARNRFRFSRSCGFPNKGNL